MTLIQILIIAGFVLGVIWILAGYINKIILKKYIKSLMTIDDLKQMIEIKDEKVETLYKCLSFIKKQIHLSFTCDIKGDHAEHNKILNEICFFVTQIEAIKENANAEKEK